MRERQIGRERYLEREKYTETKVKAEMYRRIVEWRTNIVILVSYILFTLVFVTLPSI